MWNSFGMIVAWLLLVFFCSQALVVIGLIVWMIWIDAIKPRLIPATEIDRVAADIIANYSDPQDEAFARQKHAWYRCDGAE